MFWTEAQIQTAFISWLKTQVAAFPMASGSISMVSQNEIREAQYQSTNWVYPTIRVSLDLRPSIEGCSTDDADILIEAYSEQKSSLESKTITGLLYNDIHRQHFKYQGIMFTLIVTKIEKSVRSIYAWKSAMQIHALVA